MSSIGKAQAGMPASSGKTREPRTKFLVVCGASVADDSWFFGNFLGFCRVFMSFNVDGEFWNTFPVKEYFDTGVHASLKFGKKSGKNETAYELYTKWEFEHRQQFWKQFPVVTGHHTGLAGQTDQGQGLISNILAHIDKMSKELIARDIFNIILMGHGDPLGVSLGGQKLHAEMLATALDHFQPGVQVNVVVQSCMSGSFINRIKAHNQPKRCVHTSAQATAKSYTDAISGSGRFRNSKFSGTFVRSLGFAYDEQTKQPKPWSLKYHIDHVLQEGKTLPINEPQAHIDLDLLSRFMDILITDFVDYSFTSGTQTARRIITPSNPAITPPRAQPVAPLSDDHLTPIIETVRSELSFINDELPEPDDARLCQAFHESQYFLTSRGQRLIDEDAVKYSNFVRRQLEALRWRFRVQEPFYHAMEALVNKDLLSIKEIRKGPLKFRMTEGTAGITTVLRSFSVMQACLDDSSNDLQGLFPAPVMWFAALIQRACTDIQGIMSFLLTTKILGELDQDYFESIADYCHEFSVSVDEESIPSEEARKPHLPAYAFWLPQDFRSGREFAISWERRYSNAKRIYEGCFGEGSWGDDSEIKESILPMRDPHEEGECIGTEYEVRFI
ncbi:hypothetical protein OEA41_003573 [Lepraria neglecta]|uniref:Uncharacterized protein n=1 Tax=Lepraria neglecta TaxID=209136 RepID=A0AAE0DJ12_9LECA|nr:hypothetical protein OEA41_003573 [Lepraria neglecta]